MDTKHVDIAIIGAGICGISSAVHLRLHCPDKTFVILERRENTGGTWDLFRYPGIRSDSEMYIYGFEFKPWTDPKAIGEGASILAYLRETIAEYGLNPHIRLGSAVESAHFSSQSGLWTIKGVRNGEPFELTANWCFMCTGYYDYEKGYLPEFAGYDDFKGTIVHPQQWPENLDYLQKRVVVIGSGATAITLVPALANTGAAHVTMLQRTPTWMVSRPTEDRFEQRLQHRLPAKLAYRLIRFRSIWMQQTLYKFAQRWPKRIASTLVSRVRKQLTAGYDVEKHFIPPYKPWDQRLCLVSDGDLFEAINAGQVEVVTERIERFTEGGILLESGREVPADIIVTATGLLHKMMAGIDIQTDGKPFVIGTKIVYKGVLFDHTPNLAMWIGSGGGSLTLRADTVSTFMCRLLQHMERTGVSIATPTPAQPIEKTEYFIVSSAGYIQRTLDQMPLKGMRAPWRLGPNYTANRRLLRDGPIDDEIVFSNPVLRGDRHSSDRPVH
ncbi:MAG: NAD(P)/FAD-dependent oxidoreductase [Sphingomonadales bacterium]|nr:NAD(P)/FAD-dependent oxidoreductase [Sphingomonadales bacterium]